MEYQISLNNRELELMLLALEAVPFEAHSEPDNLHRKLMDIYLNRR